MPEQPHGEGCLRDFAAAIAISSLAGAGAWILPHLGMNPWWSALAGLVALSAYLFVAIVASRLELAAGAAYLRRVEAEKLAAVPNLSLEDAAAISQEWLATEPNAPGGAT